MYKHAVAFFQRCLSRITVILVALVTLVPAARAQTDANYTIHANIIYHFTKYIAWPGNKKSGDFIIGVIGDNAIYDELKSNVEGKKAGNQKIVIRRFPSVAMQYNCHILFIGDEESGDIRKITAKTANTPVLLVSESEGLAKKGACINFIVVDDRLQLEINKNNIEGRGLDIASELLQLGKIIK